MTNLRKLARGQPCQIRLVGVCNGDNATTVLAHFRMAGASGMGLKPPDWLGAWSCSACHSVVDQNKDPAIQLDFAKGCFRTLLKLEQFGTI